jgi:F0F1-type ATP synthase assembly protein I
MMPDRPKDDDKPSSKMAGGINSLVQAERLLQVAFVLPSAMVIGWLGGAWADSKLHQSWITIVGVIFGCVSGLFYVIRMAMAAEKSAGGSGANTNGSGDQFQNRK